MSVLFLGDSITEGIPGVGYIDIIRKEIECDCVNKGKGGDTVGSLYRRVKRMNNLAKYDNIVLFIGVNDVYGKITNVYKIVKFLRRQKWVKNAKLYESKFKLLLDYLLKFNDNIIIVPPLIIGEDDMNIYNLELKHLANITKTLTSQYDLEFVDVRREFLEYLKKKEPSQYLPINLVQLYRDTKIVAIDKIDHISEERGLYLTLDGVHLNTKGANIVAKSIIKYLE